MAPTKELDSLDLEILRILQRNSDFTHGEIIDQLHKRNFTIDRTGISRRIKKLHEEKYILGCRAVIDPKKIGLGHSVIMFVLLGSHRPIDVSEFENELNASVPYVIESMKITGSWDYILKLAVKDMAHCNSIRGIIAGLKYVKLTQTYPIFGEQLNCFPIIDKWSNSI